MASKCFDFYFDLLLDFYIFLFPVLATLKEVLLREKITWQKYAYSIVQFVNFYVIFSLLLC